MAIGTTNVTMTAIAQEMDRAYAPGSNLSLKDLSQKHWKGGPTSYASFPEVRYLGLIVNSVLLLLLKDQV